MFFKELFNLMSHILAGLRVYLRTHRRPDDFWTSLHPVLADYYAFPNLDKAINVQRDPVLRPGGCGYSCVLSVYQYEQLGFHNPRKSHDEL